MRSLFGIFGFLGVISASILYGSPLSIFLDIPSVLCVLGPIICLSIAKFSFKEFITFSDEVVMGLINFSLIGGATGFIVGMVQMLQNMADPSAIGPAMAVALLSVFYSIVIAGALYAIKNGVKSNRVGVIAVAGSLATFLPLFILILSFTKV